MQDQEEGFAIEAERSVSQAGNIRLNSKRLPEPKVVPIPKLEDSNSTPRVQSEDVFSRIIFAQDPRIRRELVFQVTGGDIPDTDVVSRPCREQFFATDEPGQVATSIVDP